MIKGSGRNLDELNECLWAGGCEKQEKQWFHLPSLLSCESLLSVKKNTNKKRKKEEREKEKNTDKTQT